MRVVTVFTVLALYALLTNATAAADAYTGTWILDAGQSGGSSQSQVLTISVSGDQETYRSELVTRERTRQVTHYTASYDGKEYPSHTVTTDSTGHTTTRDDTVILVKRDELHRERHWQRDGRLVRVLRRAVSPDRKTLTSHVIDIDLHGVEHETATLVFDRAPGSSRSSSGRRAL